MQKNSFILYYDFLDTIKELTFEQRGKLLTAILLYVRKDTPLELDPYLAGMFVVIQKYIDRDELKYTNKCKQMQANATKSQQKQQIKGDTDTVPDTVTVPVPEKKETNTCRDKSLREKAGIVLDFLNEKAGKAFRPVPANLDFIVARLKDGVTIQTCKTLICRKINDWKGTDQAKYLRPATLFNKTKCEQYIGEIGGITPDEE